MGEIQRGHFEDFKQHGRLFIRCFDTGFSSEFINRALTEIEDRIVSMGGISL